MTRRRGEGVEGHRLERLEQLILEELIALFADEVSDPRLAHVRPIAVSLSPDYRHVKIFCVFHEGTESRSEIESALTRASAFFRRRISEAIELKRIPELNFAIQPIIAEL